MLRIARVITVFIACLSLTGGHWLVMQSVAWTQMLVNYSRSQTLAKAASDTFDGEHPCAMCKNIQEAKSTEKKSESVNPQVTCWEGVLSPPHELLMPALVSEYAPMRQDFHDAILASPPTPPPKFSL